MQPPDRWRSQSPIGRPASQLERRAQDATSVSDGRQTRSRSAGRPTPPGQQWHQTSRFIRDEPPLARAHHHQRNLASSRLTTSPLPPTSPHSWRHHDNHSHGDDQAQNPDSDPDSDDDDDDEDAEHERPLHLEEGEEEPVEFASVLRHHRHHHNHHQPQKQKQRQQPKQQPLAIKTLGPARQTSPATSESGCCAWSRARVAHKWRSAHATSSLMSATRSLFFLFNFLAFAFGVANLGLGLWFRLDPKVYEIHKYIETQNVTIAGYILLVGGFAACLASLIGFSAAARRMTGLLVLYLLLMVPLTMSFVCALVLVTVHGLGIELEEFLMKEIYEQIRRRSMNSELDPMAPEDSVQFLDFLQVKMGCCGAADFRDYMKLGMVVPTTCFTVDKNYVSAPGCGRAMRQMLDVRAGMAAGSATVSVLAQLFAIVLVGVMLYTIQRGSFEPHPVQRMAAAPQHPARSHDAGSLVHAQRARVRTPIAM